MWAEPGTGGEPPPSQASDSRVFANPQRGQPAELLCPWALRLTQVMAGIVCLLDEQVSGSYRDLKHLDITFVGMWGDKAK